MKNRMFLLCALSLAASAAWAERVNVSAARRVAETVMATPDAPMGRALTQPDGGLSLLYTVGGPAGDVRLLDAGAESEADVYVFGGEAGFVVVAGDDCVAPVLGYAPGGRFDGAHVAPALQRWLEGYAEQIAAARAAGVEATAETAAAWSNYLGGATTLNARTGGVLLETAEWGQGDPYNRFTPTYPDDAGETLYHCTTSSLATAMATVMHYHRYPEQMVHVPDSFLYTMFNSFDVFYVPATEVDLLPYEWDNMVSRYDNGGYTDAQADAVARLMRDCGYAANVEYASVFSSMSSLFGAEALTERFGYSPSIEYLRKEAYTWKEWESLIREDLDSGRPVIYSAAYQSFVCDGYTEEGYFHINWGWRGTGNGYFKLHIMDVKEVLFDFTSAVEVIRNIVPEATGERYQAMPYLKYGDYVLSGDTVTATRMGLRYSGLNDATVYLGLGVVDTAGRIVQVPDSVVALAITKDTHYISWNYHNLLNATLRLSSPLSDSQYATLLASPDGTQWEVVRALGRAPLGIRGDGSLILLEDEVVLETLTATVDIYHKNKRLAITELDDRAYSQKNFVEMNVELSDNANIFCRVTLADYATEWKDHLAVYNGKTPDAANPEGDAPFAIGDDGSFCIDMPMNVQDALNTVTTYLSFLADKAGELHYTVAAYPTARPDSCIGWSDTCTVQFVEPLTLAVVPQSTKMKVGEWLPITIYLTDVPDSLIGKKIGYSIHLDFGEDSASDTYIDYDNYQYQLWFDGGTDYTRYYPCQKNQSYEFGIARIRPASSITVTVGVQMDYRDVPTTLAQVRLQAFDYRVTAALTNLTLSGDTVDYVNKGDSLTLTFSAAAGYSLPETVTVTMGGDTLAADSYRYADGCLTLAGVTGDVVLTAEGVEQMPTAIGEAAADGLKIRTADGRLYIETTQPGVAYIIDFAGRLLKAVPLTPGETATSLPAGAYIVRVGNVTHKLRL